MTNLLLDIKVPYNASVTQLTQNHRQNLRQAFSQQTCTALFIIKFGLSNGFPAAFRAFDHFFFMARTPNMMASEDPTVLVPIALESFSIGTLKRRAIMETQRFWMSAETGYSSGRGLVL